MNLHIQIEDFGCHTNHRRGIRRITGINEITKNSPEYDNWGCDDDVWWNLYFMRRRLDSDSVNAVIELDGIPAMYCAHSRDGKYSFWLMFDQNERRRDALTLIQFNCETGQEIARWRCSEHCECSYCVLLLEKIVRVANRLV